MTAEEKQVLNELIDRDDRYALMLAVVAMWVRAHHPDALRAALYVPEADDAEPTRIRIPLGASSL